MTLTTVHPFLPEPDLARLRDLWQAAPWAYSGGEWTYRPTTQLYEGRGMPSAGEEYSWHLSRSEPLEHAPEVLTLVARLGARLAFCYLMTVGDRFRVHSDSYFEGNYSAILYLDDWKWDWGGLLHVLSRDGSQSEVVLPEANSLVLVPNGAPHFVSTIESWALRPRRSITFLGVDRIPE